MKSRIPQLLKKLRLKGLEGLLVSDPLNVSYLTAFRSRESYLLVSRSKSVYFTDSRYSEDARRNVQGAEVREFKPPLWNAVAREACRLGLANLGFEDRNLTVSSWRKFADACPEEGFLKPASGIVEELRLVKSADEIEELRKSCSITVAALQFARECLVPGRTELEVAGEIEKFIRSRGAFSSSFEIIVASGPNTSLPHHATSTRKIRKNEHAYIDMGVDYRGYRSDLTRVFFLGTIAPLIQRIYKVAVEAQEEAIRRIRPGAAAAEIDDRARRYISSRGFGKYFSHALGHGVGLDVHEMPRIAPGVITRLQEGMVFTVEPAVYIPGKAGVRVEDMVLVTRKGSEVLSGSLNK
jgi:Xaa-Pro aminopeptidase